MWSMKSSDDAHHLPVMKECEDGIVEVADAQTSRGHELGMAARNVGGRRTFQISLFGHEPRVCHCNA